MTVERPSSRRKNSEETHRILWGLLSPDKHEDRKVRTAVLNNLGAHRHRPVMDTMQRWQTSDDSVTRLGRHEEPLQNRRYPEEHRLGAYGEHEKTSSKTPQTRRYSGEHAAAAGV